MVRGFCVRQEAPASNSWIVWSVVCSQSRQMGDASFRRGGVPSQGRLLCVHTMLCCGSSRWNANNKRKGISNQSQQGTQPSMQPPRQH